MNDTIHAGKRTIPNRSSTTNSEFRQYVSITIANQQFGIPVLIVHDVLGPQRITHIPMAPPEVAGSLNLRGRIVTAINVRRRLGLSDYPKNIPGMSVVVEFAGDLYSLMVDSVSEVLSLMASDFEQSPATLDTRWREVSLGIYRLNHQLLIILEVNRLLDFALADMV